MAKLDYGIEYIAMGDALPDGEFPTVEVGAAANKITNIVVDSFTRDQEDDQETDVYWEDYDGVGVILKGEKGKKTLTVSSNDMSEEAYKRFLGYKTAGGWTEEDPSFTLPPQFVQLKTRAIDIYPARIHQYTPCDVVVKETGTIGKNGLPELQFTITRTANKDAAGKQVKGHRFQDVVETAG